MMTYESYFHTVSRVGVIYQLLKGVFGDETWSDKLKLCSLWVDFCVLWVDLCVLRSCDMVI